MANQVMYGFLNLDHLFDRRATAVGEQIVSDAIDATVAEHERQLRALLGIFAEETTGFQVSYQQSAVARLQPGTETSRAKPIVGGAEYNVAFPLRKGDGALGVTYLVSQQITVAEVNDQTAILIGADMRWVRDFLLAALYTNVAYNFVDTIGKHGTLAVQPLAITSDGVLYNVQQGADAGATDQHFLAQAAAIADATNPYPAIYEDLVEHPENSGEVVAFIPTALVATTRALATFVEASDPNIRPGANTSALVGSLGVETPGQLIGYVDGVWIIHWRSMPAADIIIATTTGGSRPLAIRQHEVETLRGFRKVAERTDYPWYESQWFRLAGFGAWNRVGAVVYRIGNAAYAIPTNYNASLMT